MLDKSKSFDVKIKKKILLRFRDLVELGEKIESTTKRDEMVGLASDFLKRLELEEVEPAACMLLGRPFPNTSSERLDVSWATLFDIIARITGAGRRDMESAFGRTGDIGAATAIPCALVGNRRPLHADAFYKFLFL